MQGTGMEATIQKEPTLLSDTDSAAVIAYLQLFRFGVVSLLTDGALQTRHQGS